MSLPHSHLPHPKYRPDIDGLRAIAVLSVIVFHAFPSYLTGGFIGVDVFFVISGYLISTTLFENLDKGEFSFTEFYIRRVKRIFPALLIVLIACFAFGWFTLLADEFKQLGKHIAAAVGFISNIVLRYEAGYFDNSAETKPLLHLWSLGIEEQFYFSWPLLLWIAWKIKFNRLALIILATTLSFLLNIKGIKQNAVAVFYSPQTRFWELLSGSLLAWLTLYTKGSHVSTKDGKTFSNILSLVGLFLLTYGFFRLNKDSSFPGFWAVVPVLGSILIISAGAKTWINHTILSNKVVVWFGLISYPLYLWHWPLLSFARIIEGEVPGRNTRISAVVLSIVLAWITYILVERRIRTSRNNMIIVTTLLVLMTVMGIVGYNTYIRDGLRFRQNAQLKYSGDIGHFDYHKHIAEKYYICTPEIISKAALKWEGFVRCMQSKPTSSIDIALVGDSHAEHLFLGVADALPTKNVAFYIQGSPPLMDNSEYKNIFDTILTSKSIKVVILSMHFNKHLQVPPGLKLDTELIKVVDAITNAGKKVFLTDDVPLFPFSPHRCNSKRWLATKKPICEMSVTDAKDQIATYMSALNKVIKSRPNVKILQVGKYFCDNLVCSMTKGKNILYRDNNHLNLNGSLYVGRRLVEDNVGIFD